MSKYDEITHVTFYKVYSGELYLPRVVGILLLKDLLGNFFKTKNYLPFSIKFTGTLRDYQIPVVDNCLSHLKSSGTVTIEVPPASGKTIIACKLSSELGLLTAVIVPREIIARQWVKSFGEKTDAKIWMVGEEMPEVFDVIVCMKERYEKINPNVRERVGTLIIDEAHMFCTPESVGILLCFSPLYIIAETAGLRRKNGLHVMIQSIVGNHVVDGIPLKKFKVYKINLPFKGVRERNTKGGVKWSSLMQSVLYNPERDKVITEIIHNQISKHGKKFIVLTSETKHVGLLNGKFKEKGLKTDFMAGRKSEYYEGDVLVGNIPKIGTGFDESNSCKDFSGIPANCLAIVSSIKYDQLLLQCVGRCLRSDNPIVFHFVDEDSIISKHWQECEKWYKSKEMEILDFNPNS